MTCIVGIEYDGGVLIGGDSAGTAGCSQTIRADEKVFTNGPYVMGFTSSFRMGQLLRYSLNAPVPGTDDHEDLDRFIATVFIEAVRDTLKSGGFAVIDKGQEEGGTFLMGLAGRLYMIDNDYQFGRSVDGYAAVGCGDDIALGSLHTTAQYDIDPLERVQLALEAATALNGGVAGPFTIIDHPA